MTLLSCGCEQDGSARCPKHVGWGCHSFAPEFYRRETLNGKVSLHPIEAQPVELEDGSIVYLSEEGGGLCPPCRIAKWRSVSLSSAATPTRGKA